jgi:hypothetical protein
MREVRVLPHAIYLFVSDSEGRTIATATSELSS